MSVCGWRAAGGGRAGFTSSRIVLRTRTYGGWRLMLGVVPMMLSAWVCVCSECVACARG